MIWSLSWVAISRLAKNTQLIRQIRVKGNRWMLFFSDYGILRRDFDMATHDGYKVAFSYLYFLMTLPGLKSGNKRDYLLIILCERR
jgi:hypothetical protein